MWWWWKKVKKLFFVVEGASLSSSSVNIYDLRAKNQWTGAGTIFWAMKAEGKKLKIKGKIFIDFRLTRNPVQTINPPKKSTWPYLNEFLPYSWDEDKGITSSVFMYFCPPWPCSDPTPSIFISDNFFRNFITYGFFCSLRILLLHTDQFFYNVYLDLYGFQVK